MRRWKLFQSILYDTNNRIRTIRDRRMTRPILTRKSRRQNFLHEEERNPRDIPFKRRGIVIERGARSALMAVLSCAQITGKGSRRAPRSDPYGSGLSHRRYLSASEWPYPHYGLCYCREEQEIRCQIVPRRVVGTARHRPRRRNNTTKLDRKRNEPGRAINRIRGN